MTNREKYFGSDEMLSRLISRSDCATINNLRTMCFSKCDGCPLFGIRCVDEDAVLKWLQQEAE